VDSYGSDDDSFDSISIAALINPGGTVFLQVFFANMVS
jgi:hypothetical protein